MKQKPNNCPEKGPKAAKPKTSTQVDIPPPLKDFYIQILAYVEYFE